MNLERFTAAVRIRNLRLRELAERASDPEVRDALREIAQELRAVAASIEGGAGSR